MKSFVVQTYYQLMHSMAMALTFEEKPCLFFAVRYLDAGDDLLDRILETGVFSRVTAIDRRGDLTEFISQLHKTRGMTSEEIDKIGNSLFEKYLEPYYSDLFKKADKEDEIFIYNDYHWYFYYVSKHFKHIVGAEDGYASLTQQLKIHKFSGDRELVKPFLGKYYPLPGFKDTRICRIVSSRDFDDLPEEYRDKLDIIDYLELVEKNRSEFSKAINRVFETDDMKIEGGDVLFLAQALARSTYCLSVEEYLLNKRIISGELEKGRSLCFKSHPADSIDGRLYERQGVRSLPGTFPVEVLNYQQCSFDRTLSFGSTGVETLECSGNTELIFGDRNAERKEVEEFIKKQVQKEQVIIDIYIIVRNLDYDSLVHVFSGGLAGRKYFTTRLNVIVARDMVEEARKHFISDKLADAIDRYSKSTGIKRKELEELKKRAEQIQNPAIIGCDDVDDVSELWKLAHPDRYDYDYVFFVDQDNLLFNTIKSATRSLSKQIGPCVVFPAYSLIKNKKMEQPWISSLPGFIDRSATEGLMNKVVHRAVISEKQADPDKSMMEIIDSLGGSVIWFSNDLYIPTERFTDIDDGAEHYSERMSARSKGHDETSMDSRTMAMAEDIYSYLNWLQLSDRKYGADEIDYLLQQADITDGEKIRALEELCSTLYFEKYRRFRTSFGMERDRKKDTKGKKRSARRIIRELIGGKK